MSKNAKLACLFSGSVLTSMFLLNKLNSHLNSYQNILQSENDFFYDCRYGKIRYQKTGKGTPVLCIHNLVPGSSLHEFEKLTKKLSLKHEVYCLDLLGYGLSDKPALTYTSFLLVECVIDFIKNVIQRKTDLIVSNEAVTIAISACYQDPSLFRKIVLIHPMDLFCQNEIASFQLKCYKKVLSFPIIGKFIYHIATGYHMTERYFYEEGFYQPSKIRERDISSIVQANRIYDSNGVHLFASYQCKYLNYNFLSALKKIDHSIMILSSAEEENMQTIIDNYTYYNKAIESYLIPHCKKEMLLECPNQIHYYLDTFL